MSIPPFLGSIWNLATWGLSFKLTYPPAYPTGRAVPAARSASANFFLPLNFFLLICDFFIDNVLLICEYLSIVGMIRRYNESEKYDGK